LTTISEDALKLLKEKQYFKENEKTWEDLCERVSTAIAEVETNDKKQQIKKEVYEAMSNLEFIFSTPVLLNADKDNPGQLSSCFVLQTKDNIEDICLLDAEFSKIFQRNGGAGTDISVLRPAKAKVDTSKGYAGGVTTFMGKYDRTADDMTKFNPSRKGALKINLQCWHPQLLDFIHSKDNTSELKRMNISISLTDDFMKAVENDEDWNLEFPDYQWNKEIYNQEWNGDLEWWKDKGYPTIVYQTLKAKEILEEIARCSWETGEPGANYQSRMDADNPNKHLSTLIFTNPCLHKDTYMVTENGLEKISNIKSKMWNGEKYVTTKTWQTGIKKVYKIMTKSGYEYTTTEDHKFMLKDGSWCKAIDLIGKDIAFEIKEKEWIGNNLYPHVNYKVLGFEFGDATFHKASNRMKYIFANPEKDKEAMILIEKELGEKFYAKDSNKQDINHVLNIPYGTVYANAFYDKIDDRMIPDWIMTLPKNEMKDFLIGLFSANGCNLKEHHRIQLVSINTEMLKQVQQMLLMFGVKGKLWYHNKKNDIEFSNGTYTCKQSAHIVISRNSYKKFLDEIGFIQDYKNGYLEYQNKLDEKFETVILISELDEAEVWDFTENELHMGITNGAYVHNCNEFSNIPNSSCNLGSINIYACIKDGKFNWDKLKILSYKAIRWFDNMISINKLPLTKIQQMTEAIRPIGMGMMGLADALYVLGIKYNSQKGYDFAERIIKVMKDNALKATMDLAEERGVYPAWEGSEWQQQGLKVRNSSLLSIAPNGTISFLAGVSGGCEPQFGLTYSRRTYDNNIYFINNPTFENKLKELGIYSEELMGKIENNHGSCQGIKEIPKEIRNIFVTAHDLSPKEHVNMVSVLQKHVDLSLSKTVNFSSNASVEDIYDIYIYAWKEGLKGLAVYRDGSRQNQTLSGGKISSTDEDKKYVLINETLDIANSVRLKIKTGCGSMWLTLVYDNDNNLCEIFSQSGSTGGCRGMTEGLSRSVSLLLRANVDPLQVIDQLQSVSCDVSKEARKKDKTIGKSCADSIAKQMLKFINGELSASIKPIAKLSNEEKLEPDEKDKCPDCGIKLKHISGCISCVCGYSKC